MCMAWPCNSFVDGHSYKCIDMYKKKVKLINHDCLPISMLLYIMLYLMLAYIILLAALSNAACLHNAFLAIYCCKCFLFHALSWFIETQFVYFKYDFLSCAVLLICWFFLILCSHHFLHERAMCYMEK